VLTVEWDGTQWVLVKWEDVGFLTRKGTVVASLKSKDRPDAECEAMLRGLM
jgi:hypothetical protein